VIPGEVQRFFEWADPASSARVIAVAGEAYDYWQTDILTADEMEALSPWCPSRMVYPDVSARVACDAASELAIIAALWPETPALLGPVRLPRQPRRRRIA
jgi:hypothetical protein